MKLSTKSDICGTAQGTIAPPHNMSINYLIIGFTCLVSIAAFNNPYWVYKMKHWPVEEARKGEYYRWLTSGFLHANPAHLIFNMITLYFFGGMVEQWFMLKFPDVGGVLFLCFYLLAIAAASSATYYKYRHSPSFASIGASGAVAAVLFTSILILPTNKIYLFFVPIGIPGFIFGILYLYYSAYAARRGGDNIDHSAHYFGALFGFFFPMVLEPELARIFLLQLQHWIGDF